MLQYKSTFFYRPTGICQGTVASGTQNPCWRIVCIAHLSQTHILAQPVSAPAYLHAQSLQSCPPLCFLMDWSPPGSSVHGDSPDKNTGAGYHALLQGILPTQGLNPDFLHCRQILYRLSHQGSLLHPSSAQNASFHLSPESMIARHLTPSTSTFFSTKPLVLSWLLHDVVSWPSPILATLLGTRVGGGAPPQGPESWVSLLCPH